MQCMAEPDNRARTLRPGYESDSQPMASGSAMLSRLAGPVPVGLTASLWRGAPYLTHMGTLSMSTVSVTARPVDRLVPVRCSRRSSNPAAPAAER
jgi:hypothetical protein